MEPTCGSLAFIYYVERRRRSREGNTEGGGEGKKDCRDRRGVSVTGGNLSNQEEFMKGGRLYLDVLKCRGGEKGKVPRRGT